MSEMRDTEALDRVREIALLLPESEERESDGQATFFVAGEQFAQVRANRDGDGSTVVYVRSNDADEQAVPIAAASWVGIELGGEIDWTLVEDRIARSWELSAPAGLLEAGGR